MLTVAVMAATVAMAVVAAANQNGTSPIIATLRAVATTATTSQTMAIITMTENKTNAAVSIVTTAAPIAGEEGGGGGYTPWEARPETYIVPIVFFMIFVIGVLGNGTLVIIFMRHRAMRNVPNTYILSLALADLLVIITTVPLTTPVYITESWPWGAELCTLAEFVKDVSIGVSVFTLTALSGDRFFAIVDPLRKFNAHGSGRRATRMTIAIAVLIWILAAICGIPAIFGSNIKELKDVRNETFRICYPFPAEWGATYAKTIVLTRFLIYYAVPLVIIGIFYALIAKQLVMSLQNVPGETQGTQKQIVARRKVAVTVLAFIVIFGICFFPQHCFMLWFYYNPTAQDDYNQFWHVLRIIGFCLTFVNSCANPVALYCVSGTFRKYYNRYLFCRGPNTLLRSCGDGNNAPRDTSMTSVVSRRFPSRHISRRSTIRSQHDTGMAIVANGKTTSEEMVMIGDRRGCL